MTSEHSHHYNIKKRKGREGKGREGLTTFKLIPDGVFVNCLIEEPESSIPGSDLFWGQVKVGIPQLGIVDPYR